MESNELTYKDICADMAEYRARIMVIDALPEHVRNLQEVKEHRALVLKGIEACMKVIMYWQRCN